MNVSILSASQGDVDIQSDFTTDGTECHAVAKGVIQPPPWTAGSARPTFEEHASGSVELLDELLFPDEFLDTQIAAQNNDALSQFYRVEVNAFVIVGWKIDPTRVAELSVIEIVLAVFGREVPQ